MVESIQPSAVILRMNGGMRGISLSRAETSKIFQGVEHWSSRASFARILGEGRGRVDGPGRVLPTEAGEYILLGRESSSRGAIQASGRHDVRIKGASCASNKARAHDGTTIDVILSTRRHHDYRDLSSKFLSMTILGSFVMHELMDWMSSCHAGVIAFQVAIDNNAAREKCSPQISLPWTD